MRLVPSFTSSFIHWCGILSALIDLTSSSLVSLCILFAWLVFAHIIYHPISLSFLLSPLVFSQWKITLSFPLHIWGQSPTFVPISILLINPPFLHLCSLNHKSIRNIPHPINLISLPFIFIISHSCLSVVSPSSLRFSVPLFPLIPSLHLCSFCIEWEQTGLVVPFIPSFWTRSPPPLPPHALLPSFILCSTHPLSLLLHPTTFVISLHLGSLLT